LSIITYQRFSLLNYFSLFLLSKFFSPRPFTPSPLPNCYNSLVKNSPLCHRRLSSAKFQISARVAAAAAVAASGLHPCIRRWHLCRAVCRCCHLPDCLLITGTFRWVCVRRSTPLPGSVTNEPLTGNCAPRRREDSSDVELCALFQHRQSLDCFQHHSDTNQLRTVSFTDFNSRPTFSLPYLYNRVCSELTGLFTLEWTHPANNNSEREINNHYCSQTRV